MQVFLRSFVLQVVIVLMFDLISEPFSYKPWILFVTFSIFLSFVSWRILDEVKDFFLLHECGKTCKISNMFAASPLNSWKRSKSIVRLIRAFRGKYQPSNKAREIVEKLSPMILELLSAFLSSWISQVTAGISQSWSSHVQSWEGVNRPRLQ